MRNGAPGGIGFEFLAVRPPGVEGQFTIRELRDATVLEHSYRKFTFDTEGRVYEPQSVIDEPSDMRVADGRTVGEAFGVRDDEARVMRTLLYGGRISGDGSLVVVPDIGFGDTEKLEFTLPFESLQTEPVAY